jgi:DNA helicase-2/ATP-dependent DNA helicase PcrA
MATSKTVAEKYAVVPDERQREAIEHVHGPMLVVAGAGTGKTTVLIRRIARLIREEGIKPENILATTYTENAGREMLERVKLELRGTDVSGLQVKTFHAYCNELLIREGKHFDVLDEKDFWIFLRRRIAELKLKYFVRAANVGQFLSDLLNFMGRCHDELVTPERYAAYVADLELGSLPPQRVSRSRQPLSDEEVLGRCRELAQVFTTAERMLKEANLGTFSHMITHAHALLATDTRLLAAERERTRYILVDEFQDANFAQVKILHMLAGDARNVFAVGDPDQGIYRFRGASSAAFRLFQSNFPGAKLVILDRNRRSTTPILKTAYAIIAENPSSFPAGGMAYERSPLISARDEEARASGVLPPVVPVDIVPVLDKHDAREVEAADLVHTIREIQKRSRCSWGDFAVIYRSHFHREEVAEELSEQGIPFSIENMDVTDTPDIRDIRACIGAVVSTSDGASLFRVAALPQFAIDPEQLRAGLRAAPKDAKGGTVAAVLAQIQGGQAVLDVVQQTRDELKVPNIKSRAALQVMVRRFGLNRDSPAIKAFLNFVAVWEMRPISGTGTLADLVQYLTDFREAGGEISMVSREHNAVHLISVHGAKGMEFKHVFVIRLNSQSFPCNYREPLVAFPRELRDPDSFAEGDDKALDKEEERRLFYVAMTRAKDTLTLYAKAGKGKDTTPPGFLRELLTNHTVAPFIRQRSARPLQTQIFATAEPISRTSEWLSLPPVSILHNRLSATAVDSYDRCPLQFKMEREWRLPREIPAALHYGSVMHTVLKAYNESVRAGRPLSRDSVIEMFRALLLEAGIPEKYQHGLYENLGVAQLTAFIEGCERDGVANVIHTEETFEIKIGETTVAGRIDRIDRLSDGRVAVIDYKTGKSKSQDDADVSLQLSIYAIAAREKWQYDAGSLVFYNLEQNASVFTRREPAELEGVRQKILEVARNIAEGKFEGTPGFHCAFCPYETLCPKTEKKLYVIPTAKKAVSN